MQTGHRFRITGLPPEPFRHLFGLSGEELAAHGARRLVVDENLDSLTGSRCARSSPAATVLC